MSDPWIDKVPVNGPIAGGAGTAIGLYAYGAGPHKMMCGSLGYIVGSSLALSSVLCTDDDYGMQKKGEPAKRGQRGAGKSAGQTCNVLFGDPDYGLTTDNAVGCLTALMTIMYCGGNWGQALAGVGGGLVGSTAIQYMRSPGP